MTCKIFSKLNYSVSVKYGKAEIEIPARCHGLEISDESKLGNLPDGISVVTVKRGEE
jgi:hypothetical protein